MTSQPRARAVTYEVLLQIQSALEAAESAVDFLAQVDALLDAPGSVLELPYDTGAPDPLDPGRAGDKGRDTDNASKVYEYLGAMDPANAADRRLWTFLAFVSYREYMAQRWPLSGDQGWKKRAETRWMMTRVSRGRLVRHGIARLWWLASLTYDPKLAHPLARDRRDPYAYTRAVLGNEDRVIALFDREAGALSPLVRCVLDHLEDEPERASDVYLRDLMKELTLIYGYRDLSALDQDQLQAVVATAAPR